MPKVDRFIGRECPTCKSREPNEKPLYIAIALLAVISVIMIVLFFKYSLAKKEGDVCMSFKLASARAQAQINDVFANDRKSS